MSLSTKNRIQKTKNHKTIKNRVHINTANGAPGTNTRKRNLLTNLIMLTKHTWVSHICPLHILQSTVYKNTAFGLCGTPGNRYTVI